ncbi:MAG: hypothetical protein PHG66_01720 [Candidatus Colwellbacteria bacterium]|nr:hypothetical protein [Candidatus Colwellbacteria bacterium]
MKIVNSKRYFLTPINLDKLIKRRSHKSYQAECRINLSHPEKIEEGYRYILNYNCLHKEIYKKLISDIKKSNTIDQKKVKMASDIFWSLFSDSSISAVNLKAIGILTGTESTGYNVMTQTTANSTGEASLNFNFWCSSPAQFAFLNIVIITTGEIDSIKFDSKIIHCSSDIYSMIANKEIYTPSTEKDMVIFCSGGTLTKIQASHAQKYYSEIVCSFSVPYITDPKLCKVRVWGEDRQIDDANFLFQEEGESSDDIFGASEYWKEYICLDKNRVDDIKKGRKISILVSPMEYKLPEYIISKYVQMCDDIAEQKLLWILWKTGQSLPTNSNKSIFSLDKIKRAEIDGGSNLSHEIMTCHSAEEREIAPKNDIPE